MNDNPPNDATPLDEELVAYLDGELDAEGARRIEALLASDPEIRLRLQSFERTWDLLDELDAAPVGEPFTQTTLEMVAIAARRDVEQDEADALRRRRRWLILVGVSFLVAATAGFVALAMHNPDRQLLQDLPLLENLDEYAQVGSIEFLRKLRDEKLFAKDAAEPSKGETADDEGTASRRERITNMSLDEKEQLVRSEDRFAALSREEKRIMRRLHEDLQNDADAEQLRAIMHDYCEWLKLLSPLRYTELAQKEPDDRIASVKKRLQEEQRREGGRRPGQKDMDAVWKWLGDCAKSREKAILAALPEPQRMIFTASDKTLQQQMLAGHLWWQWLNASADTLPPTMAEVDLTRLRKQLSKETRTQLEGKPALKQWQLVAGWMRPGPWRADEGRRMRGPLPMDDDERIAEFFESLSPEQRDQLLAMPGDEIQWRLRQMYMNRMRSQEGPGRRPDGPQRRNRRPDGPGLPWLPQPDATPTPSSGK